MVQKAKVVETSGNIATIEVSRKAMCDGCHKTKCGDKCAMSAIFANGSTMSAEAVNSIGAKVGDTVEIETSDSKVLGTATIVFILPILIGALFYTAGVFFGLKAAICVALAVFGFVSVFPFLRIIENKKRKKGPELFICRIITDEDILCDDDSDN